MPSANKPFSMPSNPNPRSSEISNPMRRSFSGNPFSKPSIVINHAAKTPANSPSEFSRRSAVGVRESGGSLRDFVDDKENGKDQILKSVKVRSPAACSKGSKNFMSPTISASFKVNESPRKKVLAERNEAVPSPVDPKSHVRKVTFAEPLEERRIDGTISNFEDVPRSSLTSEDLSGESETSETRHLMSKNDADLLFESVDDMNVNVPLVLENDIHTEVIEPSFETQPDCVNLDPTFKLSPMATPPVFKLSPSATPPVSFKATVIAPLDEDPLMAPYDPKTNYLSPRPQFLHYKPKSRMELCRERELANSLLSESFSETEVTEDAQSDGSQKESEDVSSDAQSDGSQKESEDVSSDETVKEEEGHISEPSPATSTLKPEETVEAKEVPKPRFTVRGKAVALILLLTVAFVSISVTDSPVIDQAVFEDFYKVYQASEFSEFARANFDQFTHFAETNLDELARNLQIRFTKLLSSISEYISDIRGANNLDKFQYYNLTVQQDYSMVVDQNPIFGHGENEIGKIHEPVLNAEESDAAFDIGSDEDNVEDISAEQYEVYEEQLQEDIATITGVENALDAPESGVVINTMESEPLAEAGNLEANLAQEAEANLNVENQPSLNSEVAEIVIEEAYGSEIKQSQENDAELNLNKQCGVSLDSDVADVNIDEADEKSVSIDAVVKGNEERLGAIDIPPHAVLYLVLCAGTVLIAGAAFNSSRKGKIKSSSMEKSFPSKNKQISPEKPSGPIEDVLEDSPCPSATSSFQQSSFYSEKVENESKKSGLEKKRKNNYRRESFASSSDYSMGSSSYGSLTVYEKIPIKQGHVEEEIITPVRRSSRIRNQATSPL